MKGDGKCACNLGMMGLAVIVMTLAVWALAGGFIAQFNSTTPTAFDVGILVWYLVGFVLLMVAKMCKWKAHENCPVHPTGM